MAGKGMSRARSGGFSTDESENKDYWRGLVQLKDGQHLFAPLSNSTKIKYTCIAVSSSHVILGANSGGVYCFTASDFQFTRLLANREGSISVLGFSPLDRHLLAVVAGGYNVCFWEHNLDDMNNEAKRFHVSSILRDTVVTDMIWDGRGTRLFYGDNQGRIAIAFVPKFARKFGSSSLFKRVDEIIHVEKGAIVQLDMWQDLLLVSTSERCCILKLQGESVESMVLVGARAIRNGSFGACFYPRMNGRPPIVYSARPKGRLWAADIVGDVISTVRPREFLVTNSIILTPSTIINVSSAELSPPPPSPSNIPCSFNFHRLGLLSQRYLVTWQGDSLFVQTFHESSFAINMWFSQFRDIVDVVFSDDQMYVLHDNCQSISCLSYLNISDTLTAIIELENYPLILEMLNRHTNIVKQEVPQSILTNIVNFIMKQKEPVEAEVQELIDLVNHDERHQTIDSTVVEETDNDEYSMQVPEECVPIEEANQFSMEGTEEPLLEKVEPSKLSDVEDETKMSSTDKSVFVSHTFPEVAVQVNYMEESSHSLTQLGDHLHQSEVATSSIVSPSNINTVQPLTARMSGDKLIEAEEDLVVVRSISRDKRRKSKGSSKKKRNSVDLTKGATPTSSLKLEDIFEGEDVIGPALSPSQLSSNTTSLDNSPHASLPSSPPKPLYISQPSSTDIMTEEGSPKAFRSLSLDVGCVEESHDRLSRSLSQSFEPDILRPTKLLSKVKSMASSQDGSIQKTGRMMKGLLLSSISGTTPIASTPGSIDVRSSPEVGESVDNNSRASSSISSPPPLVSNSYCTDMNTQHFIEAVNKAMQLLNTPQILCLPYRMKETLLEWLKELKVYHSHLLELQKTDQQNLSYANFLSHDLSAKESVSELINLCLEMEIYPDADNELNLTDVRNGTADTNNAATTTDTNNTTTTTDTDNITTTADTDNAATTTNTKDISIAIANNTVSATSDTNYISATTNDTSAITNTNSEAATTSADSEAATATSSVSMTVNEKQNEAFVTVTVPTNIWSTCIPKTNIADLPSSVTRAPTLTSANSIGDIIESKPNFNVSNFESFITRYGSLMLLDDLKHRLDQKDLASACVEWRTLASQLEDKNETINQCLSPQVMLKMYQEDKDALVMTCMQQFPNIQPWEMVAVCCIDVTNDVHVCDGDTYLQYLDLVFTEKIKNEFLVNSESLILLSVPVALGVPPTEAVKSSSGSPLPNSHCVKWPHEASLIGLTNYCMKHCSEKLCEKVIELFENAGYWKGYIELCVSHNMKQRMWAAVSSLSNYSLLHDLANKDSLFDTPVAWQFFTSSLSELSIDEVSKNDRWTWEFIVRVMLGVIGVDESGKILQGLNLQCPFPSSLYYLLTGIEKLHREQRTIAHSLLEIFDRYLWSVRPHSLGPYLVNVYQKEEANLDNGEVSRELTSPPPGSHPSIPMLFMEDAAAHWGIKLNTTECMVCGYTVVVKISDKERGAVAYQCGHLYHRQCLPEQACVLCFVKNYKTKLPF